MEDAISYIRVSSDEQADSGLGLEAQRQRIAAYCDMKGLRLVEVFEDPGISGGKPLATRPASSSPRPANDNKIASAASAAA
jgi:DNA invertase Pin-like site-specific DNA recombinase